MQVIGAGFGRTGTDSLKTALELLLGGKCYHMKEVIAVPGHLEAWQAFGRRGRTGMDWHTLLEGYEAGVDWPICNYYKELMVAFPDAKVLLSVREPDSWFDSYMTLVRINAVTNRLRFIVPKFRRFKQMVDTTSWHIFGDRSDRTGVIDVFNRHIREVRAGVPPDRLLVFRVQDGWGPLCDFLGVEIPDEPFPHVNARDEIQRFNRQRISRELVRVLAFMVLAIAAVGLAVWAAIYALG